MTPCHHRLLVFAALAMLAAPAGGGELPVLRRSFAERTSPAPSPFAPGKFEPLPGETIALLGGTDVHEMDRHGWVEAAFHQAWPDRALHLRNLAWQGDTVHLQARPKHFYTKEGDPQAGSIPDLRQRTVAGIVLIGFGKMESLDGAERLPDFVEAYAALLDQVSELTPRLVLMAPPAFFPVGPAKEFTDARNATLAGYGAAIRDLAAKRGCLFVDLFTPSRTTGDASWSSNGVHLSAAGHRAVAAILAKELGFPGAGQALDANPVLLQAIERKNRLWWQYYQPTNWAFLFGDRQHVPASRDPVNREERWFVREIEALPALIAAAESDVHRYARKPERQP